MSSQVLRFPITDPAGIYWKMCGYKIDSAVKGLLNGTEKQHDLLLHIAALLAMAREIKSPVSV